MRNLTTKIHTAAVLVTLFAEPAMARVHTNFGGCTTSPENPSLVLAMLGAAAAGVPWARSKFRSRFGNKRNQD